MGAHRQAMAPWRHGVVLGTVALALAAVIAPGPRALAATAKATHVVAIDGTSYHPVELTVKKGETVRWVNKDPFPHTVTAPGAFDSKDIGAGRSWTYVARKPGRYAYVCKYHPNMKGTLVVE